MDTDDSVITAWDIRSGKTAGGIAGEIAFYKNMVDTSTYNRTSGTGGLAGADVYDTIDDSNSSGSFPTTAPGGWEQATGANWLRDPASDDGTGGGTASDGLCNGSEDCVYQDQLTGLFWIQDDATTRNWSNAITYCDGLSYGGYTDWRLPVQKELIQAYTDGIWSLKTATELNLTNTAYWSASTVSTDIFSGWRVFVYAGFVANSGKSSSSRVLCTR